MEPVDNAFKNLAIPVSETTTTVYDEAQETFSAKLIPVNQEHLLAEISSAYAQTYAVIAEILSDGRLKSLAKTALEESCMWAVKSLSRG